MTNDNKDNHLIELERKHADLDSEIDELQSQASSSSDWFTLRGLKRKRLTAKENVERYKRQLCTLPVPQSATG